MPQNNRPLPSADDREKLVEQLRANVAFEKLAFAAVAGSAVSGACFVAIGIITRLFSGALGFSGLLSVLFGAVTMVFVFFLVAFAASAVILTPLSRTLEKQRRRAVWPYAAAALGVTLFAFISAGLLAGRFAPELVSLVSVAGGLGSAIWIFHKSMQPVWADAIRADAEAKAASDGAARLPYQLH